jgi:hypothetical protein
MLEKCLQMQREEWLAAELVLEQSLALQEQPLPAKELLVTCWMRQWL